ncbi:MAG: type II and III secretion system protein family protein [Pseudomonadota bacterium]
MSNIVNKILLLTLFVFCVTGFTIGSTKTVDASKSVIGLIEDARAPGIDLTLGKAEIVKLEGSVSDVLVADPSIIDVMAVKNDRLYIVGSALGDTNIMVLDENGDVLKKLNVHVSMDTDKISSVVRELYPNEDVNIKALNDQVVLTGDVSTPAVANKITNLVGNYAGEIQGVSGTAVDQIVVNMLGIRGEQQVMLRVKIVEVSRSALKDLGVGLDGGTIPGSDLGINTNENLALTAPLQFANALLSYNSGGFGPLNLNISALEQEGIVNTLAEPNLTAISGEQAGFLAGGEFPIPTQIDENGNLVYEFRPFGVSLNFRPVVMSEQRISMQLTTEVSTATFDRNLQLNGINVPTFNVRRAETTVELPSGGTLMIAGLIQSDSISGLSGIPGASDVPVVGDLIKSDTFQRNETELLVMITPYTVAPFAEPKAVSTAAAPVAADAPVQTFSAMKVSDFEKPISIKDLPIEPISFEDTPIPMTPTPKTPSQQITLPPKQPAFRQPSKASGVFQNNIQKVYGDKAPEDLMNSMNGFGYMLD